MSTMDINLRSLLQDWDGKHTNYLIEIYHAHVHMDAFFDTIILLYLSDIDLQKPTSWLIKHHYDSRKKLPKHQVLKILSGANKLEHWESKLHILQLIPVFHIDITIAESIEPFVRLSIKSEKKFVKAAAYEAYFEIVKNVPVLQNEFKLMCEMALMNESASIRSKVRKILKKIEKNTRDI